MALRLAVTGGPEVGRSASFDAPVVAVGRGQKNDLVLRDGLVSQYHGEFVLRNGELIYRDLRSRHGTLVKVGHITVHLHDRRRVAEISLIDGAQLMLGETLMRVDLQGHVAIPSSRTPEEFPLPEPDLLADRTTTIDERIITRSRDSLETVAARLSTAQDPRLISIFKLSRELNTTTELNELLELIVNVAFEAFSAANFFAITLIPPNALDEGQLGPLQPLIARERGQHQTTDDSPLLSVSLLKRVARSRESVLFVRDEAGEDVTESIINARISACLAAPLVGQNKLIGVMQIDTRGRGSLFGADDLDLFTVMASYAAFAIERVRLNKNIVEMFEGIVHASVSAIDARDPSTAGHSNRVAELTVGLANRVNQIQVGRLGRVHFTQRELTELRYAALLHDFGKIGVRESVLCKAERLYPGQRRELVQRFESVKANLAAQAQRRLLQQLAREERTLNTHLLDQLDTELDTIISELDEMRDFILSHQGEEELDASVVARIRQIGSLTYTDINGQVHPYLLPEEVESLCVLFGTLTQNEMDHMRSHAALSRDYLGHIPWSDQLGLIPCIAGWHHEKLDGSGYPDSIPGEKLSPQVRILTICDIFDALTAADRPYRKAISVSEALDVLVSEGKQGLLDADLVALFVGMVRSSQVIRRQAKQP